MKLKTWMLALVLPLLFFAGIGVTMAFNWWKTEGGRIPVTYQEGEYAGRYNPADIRGSFSFADIERSFDVGVDVLARAFGLSTVFGLSAAEEAAAFQCKELEKLYGGLDLGDREIGTDSVRLFVALYKGLPYQPEETTVLPNPAVAQLKKLGTLSDEQTALLDRIRVDVSAAVAAGADFPAADASTGEKAHSGESEEAVVRGRTTFGELLQWGLSKDDIEEVLGMDMGARGTIVREHCSRNGIEFSAVKAALQEKLDSLGQ